MSVREEMTELVERVRREIDDQQVPPVFSGDELQAALDQHALDVRYELTRARETRSAAGVSYLDHTFRDGRNAKANFSTDVQLLDANYEEITPETSDCVNGVWRLSSSVQIVYIVGTSYCVFGAAADIAEQWAAKYKLKSNFMESGMMIQYGQRHDQIVDLAKRLRKRARKGVRLGKLISTDFERTRF